MRHPNDRQHIPNMKWLHIKNKKQLILLSGLILAYSQPVTLLSEGTTSDRVLKTLQTFFFFVCIKAQKYHALEFLLSHHHLEITLLRFVGQKEGRKKT